MAAVGTLLPVGGVSAAFVALRLLARREVPRLPRGRSLLVLRLVTMDRAGLGLGVIRCRRCGECSAVLKDPEPVGQTIDGRRLSALAHHSAR